MVRLDSVVGVAVSAVPGCWQQLLQHSRVDRRLIGGDLDRHDLGRADGPLEEPVGSTGISAYGDEHVDDLAELVDRAGHLAPLPGHLHIRLVHLPAIPDGLPAGTGGVSQQWREPLHPAVDGDMVDLDATLSQEFLDVAIDSPKRRYQRTASTMMSGGKRKPAKADREVGARPGRVLMPAVLPLRHAHGERNSAAADRATPCGK